MDFASLRKQEIERVKSIELEDQMARLHGSSAKGQIKNLQGQVVNLASNVKGLDKVMGTVGAGLDLFTDEVLSPIFGLGPRETQIETAKDKAGRLARKTVNRQIRGMEKSQRESETEATLEREGVSSLAELRAKRRKKKT